MTSMADQKIERELMSKRPPAPLADTDPCRASFEAAAPAHDIPVERFKHLPGEYKFSHATGMYALWRDAWRTALSSLSPVTAPASPIAVDVEARRMAVARAICIACEEVPDHAGDARGNAFRWQDYLPAADAAIAAY